MAARPTWKGSLKISLVSIPIKVFPATDSADGVHFHQLHQACQSRIQSKKWCPQCARDVTSAELVKGHEFETGRYVILTEAELAKVRPESAKVIDLTHFAEASALDPIALERSYYLAPDGPRASEAFAVMAAAMRGAVGFGKLAIYGREYLVAVRAPAVQHGQVGPLILHTLHHAAEIRSVDAIAGDADQTVTRVPLDQVQLARKMIARFMRPQVKLAAFTDAYQIALQQVIAAKIAGEEIVEPKPVETPTVVNLRDALTRSLHLVNGAKKRPVKVTAVAADRSPAKHKRAS